MKDLRALYQDHAAKMLVSRAYGGFRPQQAQTVMTNRNRAREGLDGQGRAPRPNKIYHRLERQSV